MPNPFGRDGLGLSARQCADAKVDPEIRAQACTAVIEHPDLSPRELSAAYNDRGLARERQDRIPEAMADWAAAVRIWPKDASARLNRGSVFREQGKYDEALTEYDAALRGDPMNASALNNRCYLRAMVGQDLDLALADCNSALRIGRLDPRALDSRGFTHLMRKEPAEALADYNGALRLDPEAAHALYGRGLAELQLGRLDEARADMREALALRSGVAADYNAAGLKPKR